MLKLQMHLNLIYIILNNYIIFILIIYNEQQRATTKRLCLKLHKSKPIFEQEGRIKIVGFENLFCEK